MDVARPRARRLPAAPLAFAGVLALAGLASWSGVNLMHRTEVIPALDGKDVVVDVVQRGTFVRAIDASGTFVARTITVVSAPSVGVVSEVTLRPGAHVRAGSVVVRLRNPALEAELAELDAQVDAARAQLQSIVDQAESARLQQQAAIRSARAESEQAQLQFRADRNLHEQGLIPDLDYRIARIKADEAADKVAIATSSLAAAVSDGAGRIAAQRAAIAGLRGRRAAKVAELEALTVRSQASGVVQSVAIEAGARVAAGVEIARIAADGDLEAVLQVAESDSRSVQAGFAVTLSGGSGRIAGRVARIDPAVQNGAVPVHVALAAIPAFARPAMHVDGAIELSRVTNALSIARPAGASDDAVIDLYRVAPDGRTATRVRVQLAHGSTQRIEVRSGLRAGQSVIISDTSGAQDAPRITLR